MAPKTEAAEIARDCLASRTRRLDRLMARIYDGALRGQGITGPQLEMLVAIELGGPTNAAWVGRRLGLEKSTVSRNLARLLAAELVESGDDDHSLRVTARGAALIRTCHPLWRRAQKQAEAALGARVTRLLAAIPAIPPTRKGDPS